MPVTEERACLACGGDDWMPLPEPGPQAMVSDGRVQPGGLAKVACRRCGLVVRRSRGDGDALFASGYLLYAHEPGSSFERARQERYATWIAEATRSRLRHEPPRRVLDVGCGNGSLLLALARVWPGAALLGCDPSADAIAHVPAAVRAWQGTAQTLADGLAELVIAVNVVEHTEDPVAFLGHLRRACTPHGTVLVVCPDGSRPGTELLIADHLHSFAASHLIALAARAGLQAHDVVPAPAALGPFQMMAAVDAVDRQPAERARRVAAGGDPAGFGDPAPLNERRCALLARWAALDRRLSPRVPPAAVCFGIGEAAGLLRAYAPAVWARIRACTADPHATLPGRSSFGDRPIVAIDTLPADTPIVVAVRPDDQQAVAARLAPRFSAVHTWYDLVGE
jgi:SAM-dependent methyltransferase